MTKMTNRLKLTVAALCCIIANSANGQGNGGTCPRGWTPWRDEKCFLVQASFSTYSAAQAACREEGGTLANVKEEPQQAFLQDFIFNVSGIEIGVWIGATRILDEGTTPTTPIPTTTTTTTRSSEITTEDTEGQTDMLDDYDEDELMQETETTDAPPPPTSSASPPTTPPPKPMFQWEDGTPVEYANWGIGSPTNLTGRDCVSMQSRFSKFSQSETEGTWKDVSCSSPNYFVCETVPVWSIDEIRTVLIDTRKKLDYLLNELGIVLPNVTTIIQDTRF